VDLELLDHFLRARQEEVTALDRHLRRGLSRPQHAAGLFMTYIVERLPDYPAMVFSRFGEALLQTRPAVALFGDYTRVGGSSRYLVDRWLGDPVARERYLVEVGVTGHHRLRRYRHADLGELELYRQLLLDPVEYQLLLVFTAVPGSPSDEKLRCLVAAHTECAVHEPSPTPSRRPGWRARLAGAFCAGIRPENAARTPGTPTHDEETDMTTPEHQLADLFVEMTNTHNPDLVDRFVAEDYVNHNDFVADGREANREFWAAFFTGLPDVKVTREDLVISGDRVVGRFVYRGTHTGDLLGIPASGKPVEMRSIDIWRVADGMFVEHWDELNLMQMFQQIGALPPLGGPQAQP
jgi:steroid delta-isomerase-like uncharacterized protein